LANFAAAKSPACAGGAASSLKKLGQTCLPTHNPFWLAGGAWDKMPPSKLEFMNPPPKLPISVCIIAGNEARRIRRALESVTDWTTEIIAVLNEEVNDGTDKIFVEFGAKIFREPWKGHIAQKNSAAEKATQPWLLGLDSDEEVPPALRAEIKRAMDNPGNYAAFCFPRCAQFCGRWIRHGDWYPDRQTRLWRRGAAEWGGVDPHDKLLVQGNVGKLKNDLLHYSMESLEHQIQKTVKYADEFARISLAEQRTVTFLDLAVRPVWRFWRTYLFRLGFLDGWQGFAIAWMTAFYTFLRYARVRESQRPKSSPHD
jgi:glycosyltransferase involved in cell wall biosynthesis